MSVTVHRVDTERGSYIEPPLKQSWDDLTKLRWHLAVVLHDHGLPEDSIRVEEGDYRINGKRQPDAYNLSGPFGAFGCVGYHHMWGVINGLNLGLWIGKEPAA